jgi:hypothetical protein
MDLGATLGALDPDSYVRSQARARELKRIVRAVDADIRG